jgi:hypothetical protein
MARTKSLSQKRPLSEVENTNAARASKRANAEPKSPKTAIRDGTEALIEAIKAAEEVHFRLERTASGITAKGSAKGDPRG